MLKLPPANPSSNLMIAFKQSYIYLKAFITVNVIYIRHDTFVGFVQRIKYKASCKSTLFLSYLYNTNFVYCFHYYIIIELVSFSCHCTERNNLCNYSHKYDEYNTYDYYKKYISLYNTL